MEFEIDVSGKDIFDNNYTIVVADKNNLIKGFKFDEKLIRIIRSRHGQGNYRYQKSKKGAALLKIRLYCIVIYYLFRSINIKDREIGLEICRDFDGHEDDINSNLKFFLEEKLGLKISIKYVRLPAGSNADKYAFLMRNDRKNLIKGYIDISLRDIERFLKR